jgi:hypothetical protein
MLNAPLARRGYIPINTKQSVKRNLRMMSVGADPILTRSNPAVFASLEPIVYL